MVVTRTQWPLTSALRQAGRDAGTSSPDSSVPAVCQGLCQEARASCWKRCVAQGRLGQSMAGSLGPACVLEGCPIRRGSTINSVCLMGAGRPGEMRLNSEDRQSLAFPSRPFSTPLLWGRLDSLQLEAWRESASRFHRNKMKRAFRRTDLRCPVCVYHTSSRFQTHRSPA